MKINIIDPGMINWAGHHADINLRVAQNLQNRGNLVKIFADKHFLYNDTKIRIEPFFNNGPYKIKKKIQQVGAIDDQIEAFLIEANIFSESLKIIDSADITFFPTLFHYQLLSIGFRHQHLGKIFGCIHSGPSKSNMVDFELWRIALNSVRSNADLRLGVLETELGDAFDELFSSSSIKFERFAIPHDGAHDETFENGLMTIGILGHQRPDKKIELIPSLVSNITKLGFKIIIQDSLPNSSIKFGKENPNIEFFGHVESMGKLIKRCSIVLLNYDYDVYQTQGSGIAWEALASGVPILAPKGTSVGKLLRKFSCGEVFDSSNSESVYTMLILMQNNYKQYLIDAQKAKEKYHLKHGTRRFVDYILSNSNT